MISIVTPILFDTLKNAGTFALFAFFNLVGLVVQMFVVKDISGLSKQQIQSLYSRRKSIDVEPHEEEGPEDRL